MKNLTQILEQAQSVETVVAPKASMRQSFRELKGLIGNTIVTSVSVANEALAIANDVVSAVPVIVQGSKEAVSLTSLFARAITLNSVLTEEQIVIYEKLDAKQRVAFRAGIASVAGSVVVNAFVELFKEEEEVIDAK